MKDTDFEENMVIPYNRFSILLYQSDDMWGFIARKVNKRDGSTAYKLVSEKESIREVPADDIYLLSK